jgi:hypothetical protein
MFLCILPVYLGATYAFLIKFSYLHKKEKKKSSTVAEEGFNCSPRGQEKLGLVQVHGGVTVPVVFVHTHEKGTPDCRSTSTIVSGCTRETHLCSGGSRSWCPDFF